MYIAKQQSVSVTNAAQNLWEIIAASSVSLLIHSLRIEFVPITLSGVAQDIRYAIAIETLSSTGTGGTSIIPAPQHPRNTLAAQTAFNGLVTNPGTVATVKSASNPSNIVTFERNWTSDQKIPISGGGRLGINLASGLGGTYTMSSEIVFEEF